jgi:hypothetical protein
MNRVAIGFALFSTSATSHLRLGNAFTVVSTSLFSPNRVSLFGSIAMTKKRDMTTLSTMTSTSTLGPTLFKSVEECLVLALSSQQETKFVDGSWHLGRPGGGRADYEAGPRIAGATFFDIDDFSSKGSDLNPRDLPHMMPTKVRKHHLFMVVYKPYIIILLCTQQ